MSSTDTDTGLHFDQSVAPLARPTSPAVDAILGVPIRVLDHGFVRLVDYLGDDAAIVQAARVSYGQGTKKRSEDHALIRYLLRHRHTSPFEMIETKFHIKAPIFVARQWLRHRTACLAGDSALSFDSPGAAIGPARPPYEVTIAEVYERWHSGGAEAIHRLPLRMCDEQTGAIGHTRITDIWQSGIKPVFRVTLDDGKTLTMTRDHRCLTERGWLTLGQATKLRQIGPQTVLWDLAAPAFATNGAWVAAPAGQAAVPARLRRVWSRIASIAYVGEAMTYDLSVAGPYHNFVANGFIVHNSVNEVSARYSLLPEELYIPDDVQISFQSADNKQGRSADDVPPEVRARVRELLLAGQREGYAAYQELIDAGIARELARIALPVAIYSEWYWKLNLHNLFHFLSLRMDAHAQYEIRIYAEAIGLIARRLAPVAYGAFLDYMREATVLSGPERAIVGKALRGEPIAPDDWARIGKRERAEFARKFDLAEGMVPPVGKATGAAINGNGHYPAG